MKKKTIKRKLKRLRRTQRQLWDHMALVQSSLLSLMDDVYAPDDGGGVEAGVGYEALSEAGQAAVQTAVKSRLKVVGDG